IMFIYSGASMRICNTYDNIDKRECRFHEKKIYCTLPVDSSFGGPKYESD
ncbi:8276_t:CDS:2, partial [Racocetra fulgida]